MWSFKKKEQCYFDWAVENSNDGGIQDVPWHINEYKIQEEKQL